MDARVGSEARAREILMGPALGLMSRLALTNQDYGAGNLDGNFIRLSKTQIQFAEWLFT